MKVLRSLLFLFILIFTLYGCFEDQDDNLISASEINDFVWKGMNAVYLYKDEIPNLANDRFTSNEEYADYLNSFSTPEELFESLIYQRQIVDRYSWIVNDYIALEQQFSGTTLRSGIEVNLYPMPGNETNLFGIVRLVLPNSNADNQGLKRGDVIREIDGTALTTTNYIELFGQDTFTVGLADYDDNGTLENLDDDIITTNGQTTLLTRENYTENPVFKTEIIDLSTNKVGYLMYNGFTSDFNTQLNNAFGNFASNNISHLVLDLRYNPGGSVLTASYLGSMITGQFNNQVFAKLEYNDDLSSNNFNVPFENQLEDGTPINSLNLDKVYVITTGSSASASEMIINSLSSYIDVVQIGVSSEGKSQASITIYDSPDLSRNGANPNHAYAMQPLVAITINSIDERVPSSGLPPTLGFELEENPSNYGTLGDQNEPLLALALADISTTGRFYIPRVNVPKIIDEKFMLMKLENEMYIEPHMFETFKKDIE